MKLWKRILESRIREKVEVAENQFGFQPGKSMIYPIFTIKLLMEEYIIQDNSNKDKYTFDFAIHVSDLSSIISCYTRV